MGIMHLMMNHGEEEVLDHDHLTHQGSGDSASAGELQSPAGPTTGGSGVCSVRDRPVTRIKLPCPRCQSMNTKFCYYNNYSVNQPRHFCRNCQRYWTVGGTLRNVPVGGGCRKRVRTRLQRSSCDDPRAGLLGAGGLVNMTLQTNILLPNTIQMQQTTQQQLSLLSQVTGGCKLGSYSSQALLQSGLIERLPPNTNLPTFLQFSNLEHDGQNHGFNAGTGDLNKIPTSADLIGFQDHHQLHSSLHSAIYELPSSTLQPSANIQLLAGGNNNYAGFSNLQGEYYHTPQKLEGNHIEFLSSMVQKPGYWGA